MEIKTLDELKRLMTLDNPPVIEVIDCGVSLFDLAGSERENACERVLEVLEIAGKLEEMYCKADPQRKTKLKPHEAVAVLVRAGDSAGVKSGYEERMNNLFYSLELLSQKADIVGVWLLIENPEGKLMLSPLEMRDLIDNLACPWVGVFFNEKNVPVGVEIDDYREILGKRIIFNNC